MDAPQEQKQEAQDTLSEEKREVWYSHAQEACAALVVKLRRNGDNETADALIRLLEASDRSLQQYQGEPRIYPTCGGGEAEWHEWFERKGRPPSPESDTPSWVLKTNNEFVPAPQEQKQEADSIVGLVSRLERTVNHDWPFLDKAHKALHQESLGAINWLTEKLAVAAEHPKEPWGQKQEAGDYDLTPEMIADIRERADPDELTKAGLIALCDMAKDATTFRKLYNAAKREIAEQEAMGNGWHKRWKTATQQLEQSEVARDVEEMGQEWGNARKTGDK